MGAIIDATAGTATVLDLGPNVLDASRAATLATAQVAGLVNSAQAALGAASILPPGSFLTATPTALPFEVIGIAGGVGTGSGGTPGEYALIPTGGPSGHKAYVTIDATGKIASYRNANPGLSAVNAAPTYSLANVPGLTGAAAPTATMGTIPVGRVFYALSPDGYRFLAWGNNAGALAPAPFGGAQANMLSGAYDTSATRYVYGRAVAGAMVGASLGLGWAVTVDGYLFAKPAIRIGGASNGLSWSQSADGFWNIQLGSAQGQLPIGTGGDMIDSTAQRYMGGSAVLWGVVDGNNNVGVALTADGYLRAKLPLLLGNANGLSLTRGSNGFYTLGFGTVAGQMPISSGGDAIDSTAQRYYRGLTVTWGVIDATSSASIVGFGGGGVAIPKLHSPAGLPRPLDTAAWFFEGALVSGFWQIFKTVKATGKRSQITTTGNNANFTLDATGANLIYNSDRNGIQTPVLMYQPIAGGAEYAVFPTSIIDGHGDSLMAGADSADTGAGSTGPMIVQLGRLLNRKVNNYGIGGQTSPQIAARQGGSPCLCTVTGNQIPASGAVTLTAYSTDMLYNSGVSGNLTYAGALAGVHGKLSGNSTNGMNTATYTFTRDSAGAAVACPANTPFIPDIGVASRGNIQILEAGRNNSGQQAQILADFAAMIGYETPLIKKFIILPVMNAVGEGIGTSAYATIMAINAALQAAYPNSFVDTRSPPTADEMAALGYTPTAQDLTDIANGCIPTGMRGVVNGVPDALHLNNIGYALQALRVAAFITAMGW
jgi:hypothetical protein